MQNKVVIQNLNQINRYEAFAFPTGAGDQSVRLLANKEVQSTTNAQTLFTNISENNTFGSTKAVRIMKLECKFIPATLPLASEVIAPALLPVIAEVIRSGRLIWEVNNQRRFDYPLQRFFVQPLEAVTTGWDGLPFSLAGSLLLNVPIDFLGYSFDLRLNYQTAGGAEALGMCFQAEGYELLDEAATKEALRTGLLDIGV